MKLQEAIKIVEGVIGIIELLPQNYLKEALETLIEHAKQPVQVTDKIVDKAWGAYSDESHLSSHAAMKAALQAALGVK